MTKIFLFVLTFFSMTTANGQITYDLLFSLRTKTLGEIETILTNKGWTISKVEEATENSAAAVTFSYSKSKETNYLTFYESKTTDENNNIIKDYNRIGLFTTDTKIYKTILTRLTTLKYVLKKSKIVDSEVRKLYKNKLTAVAVNTANLSDQVNESVPAYNILVASRKDYELWLESNEF